MGVGLSQQGSCFISCEWPGNPIHAAALNDADAIRGLLWAGVDKANACLERHQAEGLFRKQHASMTCIVSSGSFACLLLLMTSWKSVEQVFSSKDCNFSCGAADP